MKKIISGVVCSFVFALSLMSISYAYDVIIFNNNAANYMATQMFLQKTGHMVLDVRPSVSSFADKVEISYEDLSSICTNANSIGLSCSLYYNSSAEVYVIDVDDKALMGATSLKGTMGNADGKVYTAEKPEQNIHIDITTPTNPDYTDRLINIASNLDFLPIIAELNVLIADNQLLTMDYIALAIQGIWDLQDFVIDHIDDFNTAVNNRLTYIGAKVESVDNHVVGIAEQLGGIDNKLSSIIRNGQVQVNTTSLEARLDKLISMYGKVNGVVLDTASISNNSISDAVGGELQDVVFWGNSNVASLRLYSSPDINYTLNGVATHIPFTDPSGNTIVLRSVPLGSSIPSYISNDPVLLAGVWRSGSTYNISDTLDISTGVYTQRIKELSLTGAESGYGIRARSNGSVLYYRLYTGDLQLAARSSHFSFVNFDSSLSTEGDTSQSITDCTFTYANGMIYIASTSFTTLDQWTAWLDNHYTEGHPFTIYYVDGAASTWTATPVSTDSRMTIAIPEGDSSISADLLRITGKYETYDSYTQTADIINAINNLQVNTPVDLDLTPLSTRLDTLNTTISSVISEGQLKVDNSAVVAAIEAIQPQPAADLTPVITRMDAILAELQNTSGSATCEHTYTQHMEQEATCTLPGLMVSTCSKCGDSYSEIVDPLGHDWILTKAADQDVGEDIEVAMLAAANSETTSATFWESAYQRRSDGGFGSSGFGSSSSWSSAEEMASAYEAFASELPAGGYESTGKLLWQPRWIEDTSTWGLYFSGCVSSTYDGYYQSNNKLSVSYLGSEFRFTVLANVGYNCSYRLNAFDNWHSFRAPISGTYTILSSQFAFGNLLFSSRAATVDKKWKSTSLGGIRADSPVSVRGAWTASSSSGSDGMDYALDGTLSLYTPVFEIVPFTTDITINNTYPSSTRPHGFGDSTIIDETANTFYDMATGSTYTMSSWSYDYPSRTYTVTLEDDTTVTVQYGDQAMTVTSGDTTNSYQYTVTSGGGTAPDPDPNPDPDPDTPSAYDVYTCSRCQRTYEDRTGSGPEEDYSRSSISKLVVKVFSRLGTFAGKLIGSVIHLFDKAITALDNVVSKFNEYVEQISGFGGGYPAWLTGFWGVLPAELQVALTFAVICMALGVVGKKLFFS